METIEVKNDVAEYPVVWIIDCDEVINVDELSVDVIFIIGQLEVFPHAVVDLSLSR